MHHITVAEIMHTPGAILIFTHTMECTSFKRMERNQTTDSDCLFVLHHIVTSYSGFWISGKSMLNYTTFDM